MMTRLRVDLTVLLACAGMAVAQPPSFEVASIKPAVFPTPEERRAGAAPLRTKIDNSEADFGNTPLVILISRAYGLRAAQIIGPDWMSTTRFDIRAKLPAQATASQVPEMLQTLLSDRFKLTLHRDSKEFSVYALVVGKDGPKLTPKPAGYEPVERSKINPVTVDTMANLLATFLDKPVVDQTGLEGDFMVAVGEVFDGERRASPANGGAVEPLGSTAAAIAVKLGLKLEPRKMVLPIIVVDHLEKSPTEN